MKLLIVEDDKDIRKELALFFKREFEVLEAAELSAAQSHADADIILLDLNIGKDTAFSLIQELSGACIVISVRNDEASIIRALDMGAYDYVTKPFSLSILQARVHAVLRRKTAVGFRIALQQNEAVLIIDNKEVTLTKKELHIMQLFLHSASAIITRETLLQKIWDNHEAFIEDNTLTVTMSRLKSKIGHDKIETIRGIGYRWKG